MTAKIDDEAIAAAQATRQRQLDDALARGERVVGRKISLTSRAAQQRVGASGPIWGWLTDAMEIADGESFRTDLLHRTRAEAELVFVLGADLGDPTITVRDVLTATAYLCPGLELPTAFADKTPPTVASMIANNANAAGFAVGAPHAGVTGLDLALLGVLLEIDGEVAASGAGAAALGHPAQAIASLVRDLARDGGGLEAGELIFTGGLTEPIAVIPGMTVGATFAHLGRIGISIT